MKSTNGESLNILENNLKKMKQLFPEVFIENKISLEKLSEVLGEYKEDKSERYDFTWNGKKEALKSSQTVTTGTLRPDQSKSKDWYETNNLYIEGDNLEVLKLLQKSYHSKIKMIYIDPPYNTGNDFVYKDNYRDNMKNYLQYTGQVDSKGKKISTNPESSGRYHTDWLNMMYPRLRLARNLLKDDGVIFISIDDNEVNNLKKICDEIFGETNFVANAIWKKRTSPDARVRLSTGHEYVLIYAKNNEKLLFNLIPLNEKDIENYKNLDNDPRGPWVSTDFGAQGYRPNQMYDIVSPSGKVHKPSEGRCWKNTHEVFKSLLDEGRMWFGVDGQGVPRKKLYLNERIGKNSWTLWDNKDVGDTQEATNEFKKLMGSKTIFDFTKPTRLIKHMLNLTTDKESIILDFFAGSSTTAHSIMDLNAEDNGKRKFIMVQLPEETNKNSDAFKAGYKTISDIGRERIKRAGEQIKGNNIDKDAIHKLDIGFKSFKLDNSNIKEWNPEYEGQDFNFESLVNNFVEDRSKEDVLYEILLKYGTDLSINIKEHKVEESSIYDVGFGTIYICLDNNIDEKVTQKIIDLNIKSGTERARVVFKDLGFKDDQAKLNAKLTLENNGIESVLSI